MLERTATLDEVLRTTRRVSFTPLQVEYIQAFVRSNRQQGLQTGIHSAMYAPDTDYAADGLFMIVSPEVNTIFLLVKLDAGTGLFGGQKAKFGVWMGPGDAGPGSPWVPGPVRSSLMVQVASINNIHRAAGMM